MGELELMYMNARLKSCACERLVPSLLGIDSIERGVSLWSISGIWVVVGEMSFEGCVSQIFPHRPSTNRTTNSDIDSTKEKDRRSQTINLIAQAHIGGLSSPLGIPS